MKTAVFATLLASAAAFAPTSEKASTTSLAANKFASEPGVTAPVSRDKMSWSKRLFLGKKHSCCCWTLDDTLSFQWITAWFL